MMPTDNETGASAETGKAPASYSPFRTLISILGFLVFFAVIGLTIGVMAAAPWMRVSHDCSVVCVFAKDIKDFF